MTVHSIDVDKVKQIIAEQFMAELSEVTMDATLFEDLHGDSLDIIELTMSLEEEFSVEIDDEDTDACRTVADVIRMLERKIAAKS